MSNQKGKAPAVIGINKHNMLVKSYESQLLELRSLINGKDRTINELSTRNNRLLADIESTIKSIQELQVEFKARMNTITQLHDELDKEKTRSSTYKSHIEILEARKWYQLFSKRG